MNGDWVADFLNGKAWVMGKCGDTVNLYDCIGIQPSGVIFKSKQTAQKAIEILTKHFPEVLKNYFA